MIPYEELVSALARWRQRQGLPTGPADYLGEPAPASYDYAPRAGEAAPAGDAGGDFMDLSSEMVEAEESQPAYEPNIFASEPVGDDTQDQALDSHSEVYGYQVPSQDESPTAPAQALEPAPEPQGCKNRGGA